MKYTCALTVFTAAAVLEYVAAFPIDNRGLKSQSSFVPQNYNYSCPEEKELKKGKNLNSDNPFQGDIEIAGNVYDDKDDDEESSKLHRRFCCPMNMMKGKNNHSDDCDGKKKRFFCCPMNMMKGGDEHDDDCDGKKKRSFCCPLNMIKGKGHNDNCEKSTKQKASKTTDCETSTKTVPTSTKTKDCEETSVGDKRSFCCPMNMMKGNNKHDKDCDGKKKRFFCCPMNMMKGGDEHDDDCDGKKKRSFCCPLNMIKGKGHNDNCEKSTKTSQKTDCETTEVLPTSTKATDCETTLSTSTVIETIHASATATPQKAKRFFCCPMNMMKGGDEHDDDCDGKKKRSFCCPMNMIKGKGHNDNCEKSTKQKASKTTDCETSTKTVATSTKTKDCEETSVGDKRSFCCPMNMMKGNNKHDKDCDGKKKRFFCCPMNMMKGGDKHDDDCDNKKRGYTNEFKTEDQSFAEVRAEELNFVRNLESVQGEEMFKRHLKTNSNKYDWDKNYQNNGYSTSDEKDCDPKRKNYNY